MATINPDNIFILNAPLAEYSPVEIVITRPWRSRLAGTAFVEANPMDGYVIAIHLDGPTVVGTSRINEDGTWEITNIAERYSDRELIVLGISRATGSSYAIASRVKPVN